MSSIFIFRNLYVMRAVGINCYWLLRFCYTTCGLPWHALHVDPDRRICPYLTGEMTDFICVCVHLGVQGKHGALDFVFDYPTCPWRMWNPVSTAGSSLLYYWMPLSQSFPVSGSSCMAVASVPCSPPVSGMSTCGSGDPLFMQQAHSVALLMCSLNPSSYAARLGSSRRAVVPMPQAPCFHRRLPAAARPFFFIAAPQTGRRRAFPNLVLM